MQYAILEIKGKQYKVQPNKPFDVDWLGDDEKKIIVRPLLIADDGKVEIGTPDLNKELQLDNLETVKKAKIRVAKFHAKANYRKVTGSRKRMSRLIYSDK